MTIHIALLRGVNVGGHKPVSMSALRDLLSELGFPDARSLLQSGNLVFRGSAGTHTNLERLLEAEAASRLGLHTDFFIRTAQQWRTIVAHNPFRNQAARDPSHLVVRFLKDAPNEKAVKALQDAIAGPEIVRAGGSHVYIVYPAGIGRSRLTNSLLEDKLGSRGTARNWHTVLKLDALASD